MEQEILAIDEEMLLSQYWKLHKEYVEKRCRQCCQSSQQEKNECGLLRGFSKPSCMKMEKAIHRKQKIIKKALVDSMITDLEKQAFEINSPHQVSDLFSYY